MDSTNDFLYTRTSEGRRVYDAYDVVPGGGSDSVAVRESATAS